MNVGSPRLLGTVRLPATLPHTVALSPTWFLASATEIVSAKAGVRTNASITNRAIEEFSFSPPRWSESESMILPAGGQTRSIL